MSKIDEAKLNTALKTIADYFTKIAEVSLASRFEIVKLIDPLNPSPEPVRDCPNFFPDPYADMLNILPLTDKYEVYPIKFLGTDNFKAIADIVQKLGGAYVKGDKAAGVKAHFTIPKGEPKP